jgi:2-aminobenzoate-CoA ligase
MEMIYLGVVPGARVLLRGPNNPMMAACWFAVLKAGGVVVCTMPLLRAREIAYQAERARVDVALTDARLVAECMEGMRGRRDARVVCFGGPVDEPGSLEARMADKPATFADVDTAADDVALIAFTSGTTGQGKGTMHFHRDVMAITDCWPRHVLRPSAHDVFCGSPPFAFTFGLGGIVLFPMRFAASSLLLEQASPPQLLKGIRDFGATVCIAAPTAYRSMLPLIAEPCGAVPTLAKCVSAGETLPAATFDAWRRATGVSIIDGIGATEMLHIFISAADDDIRPGSTGRVVPGYEAKVVDANGDLWVTTGNSESASAFDYGNAVIRLSPALKVLDFFAPSDWARLNAGDLDLGSFPPVLLSENRVLAAGKTGAVYLLDKNHLGQIGGSLASADLGSGAFGAPATSGQVVFAP